MRILIEKIKINFIILTLLLGTSSNLFMSATIQHRFCHLGFLSSSFSLNLCVFGIYSQLGLGHTNHVREPTLVTVLQGKNVRQISAGRCHSAAWTAPPVPPRAPGEGEISLSMLMPLLFQQSPAALSTCQLHTASTHPSGTIKPSPT